MIEEGALDEQHLWRPRRGLPALNSGYFLPDERRTKDFIFQAVQYARRLTYFDRHNRPWRPVPASDSEHVGAWESFFAHDVSFFLAEICSANTDAEFRAGHSGDISLSDLIRSNVERLVRWYKRAEALATAAGETPVETAFFDTLHEMIENELIGALPAHILQPLMELGAHFRHDSFSEHVKCPEDIAFSTLNRVTERVIKRANQYLERSLIEKNDHDPQTGLYLAFVSMLQKSQIDINDLTERHLVFYYRRVLQLKPLPARPDKTWVTFELAPGAVRYSLAAGSKLIGVGTSNADSVAYVTDADIDVSPARVKAFRSVRIHRERVVGEQPDSRWVQKVDVFPVADSLDGFGQPLNDPKSGWSPFGPRARAMRDTGSRPSDAEIGLAVGASALRLSGGHRQIELELEIASAGGKTIVAALQLYRSQVATHHEGPVSDSRMDRLLNQAFCVFVSTAEGYVRVDDVTMDHSRVSQRVLAFVCGLPRSFPALVPLSDDASPSGARPKLKLVLNPRAFTFGYSAFCDLRVANVGINVTVRDLPDLMATTVEGPLAIDKPFAPFGAVPVPGARLNIWNPELAQPGLTRLRLSVSWRGLPLPPDDIASYYAAYDLPLDNDSFRVTLQRSDGTGWHTLSPVEGGGSEDAGLPLFETNQEDGGVLQASSWEVLCSPPQPETLDPSDRHRQPAGLIALQLTAPGAGFGHAAYPHVATKVALEHSAKAASLAMQKIKPKSALAKSVAKLTKSAAPPPEEPSAFVNPPLVPLMTALGADYSLSVSTHKAASAKEIELYQLTPFGAAIIDDDRLLLADDLNLDGVLMIGLDDVEAPQTVRLLFDVHAATAERWTGADGFERPKWTWGYLAGERWLSLPDERIIKDETNGLTRSGIVELSLPADIDASALSPEAPVWLTFSVHGDVDRYGRIISVTTNAMSVTRSTAVDKTDRSMHLPAGSIRRLASPIRAIKKIHQPLPTQGGRRAESEADYRIRVSERLRHKNRAIHVSDYAQMVLQEFRGIRQVRCFSTVPGRIDVVVVPASGRVEKGHVPQVPLTTRYEISKWLRQFTSPFVEHVIVRNPSYEILKVRAGIVAGRLATSALVSEVEQKIDGLVAPWLQDVEAPLPIGAGLLDVANITSELARLPHVESVLGLSMLQTYRLRDGAENSSLYALKDTARLRPTGSVTSGGGVSGEHATLRPSAPWSVFVPAPRHAIGYLRRRRAIGELEVAIDLIVPDETMRAVYLSGHRTIPRRPTPAGIGNLAIGTDLVVTPPSDTVPLSSQIDLPPPRIDRVFMPNPGSGHYDN